MFPRPNRSSGRQKRGKPIAEGGTQPHLSVCACGALVIHHKLADKSPVVLDKEPVNDGQFVLIFGFAAKDVSPGAVPDLPRHREHVCPKQKPGGDPR